MARAIPLKELPVFGLQNPPDVSYDYASGAIILIDKPGGWSSFKVVTFLRKILDIKKIGHSGTLDPMATGLLVLCTGKATRSIDLIQRQDKTYIATICFGASTASYDAETPIVATANTLHISTGVIQTALNTSFHGEITQVPPMYSAIKRQGQRLYKLARQGKVIDPPPRFVTIYDTEILRFQNPELDLRIRCSRGTYIRSIAHDLGIALGTLAHLTALVRTNIGTYRLQDALTIAQIREYFEI